MMKKNSNDPSNPYFETLNPPNPFYRSNSNAPVPSRSPSPNPFRIPRIETPTVQTIRFVALCLLWYTCSALSSNTGKVILNNFRFPVTLTIVQFFFVAGLCFLFSRPELGWATRLKSPTQAIVRGTLPMAAFQVGGHIFSSLAISRVPVSTVHTIKVRLVLASLYVRTGLIFRLYHHCSRCLLMLYCLAYHIRFPPTSPSFP
jgi:solute carrier family 35 protein E1